MKFAVTLFLFLFAANSIASAPLNMICMTEHPTTSFVAMTEDEITTIKLIHHNGTEYMPVWSNLITPNDIKVIAEKAAVLTELGASLEFKIPVKSCQVEGLLINCFSRSETQVINGRKVSLWSVSTSMENDKSLLGEYNSTWSNLGLDVDGQTYWLPMRYFENDCFFALTSKQIKTQAKAKNLFL